jgi:hypothetical protein
MPILMKGGTNMKKFALILVGMVLNAVDLPTRLLSGEKIKGVDVVRSLACFLILGAFGCWLFVSIQKAIIYIALKLFGVL